MNINGLILAAGDSSRLGQPKQLVKYHGLTLLADIEAKLLNCCDQVFVVLGYQSERFRKELCSAKAINNPNWQLGLGSSLACGAKVAGNQTDGLLIALSDQPKIDGDHYQKLVDQFTLTPDQIVSTSYQDQCGVPVIFPSHFMQQLIHLDSQKGAQSVINNHPNQVKKINCQAAGFDLDTADDLVSLR